jgi:hypothetical protein
LFSPLSHGLDSERGRKTAEEHEKFDLANREKKPNRHVRFDTYFGNTYSPLYSSGCTWDPVLMEGRHRQRRVKGGVWSFWGETECVARLGSGLKMYLGPDSFALKSRGKPVGAESRGIVQHLTLSPPAITPFSYWSLTRPHSLCKSEQFVSLRVGAPRSWLTT